MATLVNASDIILQAEVPRTITTLTEGLILQASSPVFTVDSTGAASPTSLTVTANLSVIPGTVTWSATGGTITSVGNVATLTYSNMSGTIATITATITDASGTVFTQSQTITKVQPVASAIVSVYQRSATTPTLFPGAATYTFATPGITSGALANGWTVAFPTGTNPVYVTTATFTGPGATASVTNAQWSAIKAFVRDGAAGLTGTSGTQSAMPTVYRLGITASGAPAGPSGAPTYTWSTGLFGSAPSGWYLSPTAAGTPGAGYTLWAAQVSLAGISATDTTTGFNWTSASIFSAATTGLTGSTGNSATTAYSAVSGGSGALSSSPSSITVSGTSLPTTGTWGTDGGWGTTPPSITAGQSLWQTNGIYNGSTTTWGAPYLSSLKVGELSAISANLGSITAGSITGTTITGNLIETAATGARITMNESNNNQILAYDAAGAVIIIINGSDASGPAIQVYDPNGWGGMYGHSVGGYGLYGRSTNAVGVQGQSDTGCAVLGEATSTGPGGRFSSSTGNAIEIAGGVNGISQWGGGANWLFDVCPSADNAYSLGLTSTSRWTALYAMSSTITTSDGRTKTNIVNSDLGLAFINALRPVKYTHIVGQNIATETPGVPTEENPNPPTVVTYAPRAGVRNHYGLISQEVKAILTAQGVADAAFWTLDNPADPTSRQSLRYEELISPLIAAFQQYQVQAAAIIAALTTRVAALEAK